MSFERKKAVQKANIQNFWLNQECGIFLTKKKVLLYKNETKCHKLLNVESSYPGREFTHT